jgi:hypothetical protein
MKIIPDNQVPGRTWGASGGTRLLVMTGGHLGLLGAPGVAVALCDRPVHTIPQGL